MDNIRFEYENFFEYGGFRTAYLIYRRKQLTMPEQPLAFDLSKAKRIQEERGEAQYYADMEERAAKEEGKRYQEVYDLMGALFTLIENDLVVSRYRNKTRDINQRRVNWPQIIKGYYGEEQNLQESGAANNRTKNNILDKLLDLIELNSHKQIYDFHTNGVETIRKISVLQVNAEARSHISDAFTAFCIFKIRNIGDLTGRLEELSMRLEDARDAAQEKETKICRISDDRSKVYWEEGREGRNLIYMLLVENKIVDRGENPFFYVKNEEVQGKKVKIVPITNEKIGRKIPAKVEKREYGGSRIYINSSSAIGKFELLKGDVVIKRGDKPEFYLKESIDGAEYYIRVVADETAIDTLLHFADIFQVRSDLTNLLSNTSTLTTIYKYYFLISRSIQIIEELNPKTYKKMEAYAGRQDTHKTEAFKTLSALLIDFSEI